MTNQDRTDLINRASEESSGAVMMAVIALVGVIAIGSVIYMFSEEDMNSIATTEQSSPPSTVGQGGRTTPRQ